MAATNGHRIEDIESVLSGKQHIIATEPPRRKTPARAIAAFTSRKATAAAQAEVMREALAKFIATVYEEDSMGALWNVGRDGRIEIPAPWTRNGHHRWGVKRIHAEILRHSVMRARHAPFMFESFDRRWYLDLELHPTVGHALDWLERFNLNAELWNTMMAAWRASRKR